MKKGLILLIALFSVGQTKPVIKDTAGAIIACINFDVLRRCQPRDVTESVINIADGILTLNRAANYLNTAKARINEGRYKTALAYALVSGTELFMFGVRSGMDSYPIYTKGQC